MSSCDFCSDPEVKNRTITENNLAFAFPTNIPITPGHCIISPKRHVPTFEDMTTQEKLAVFELAEKMMAALRQVVDAEGFNCAFNQGTLAGQTVPHFHLHLIPRKAGDTGLDGFDIRNYLYRTGSRPVTDTQELLRIKDKIKEFIN